MSATIEERLLARSVRDGESGCLRWQGCHNQKGYGQINVGGKNVGVHRAAHVAWIGPIPEGYEVDHVLARGCVYRDCLEPSHLEAVTVLENRRRQRRSVSSWPREDCRRGHPLDEANVYVHPTGERECLTCRRDRSNRRVPCETCGALISASHLARHNRRKHTGADHAA